MVLVESQLDGSFEENKHQAKPRRGGNIGMFQIRQEMHIYIALFLRSLSLYLMHKKLEKNTYRVVVSLETVYY